MSDTCPCCSGKPFADCCEKILSGSVKAPTAEALMRARYSAYVKGDLPFIFSSSCPKIQREFDHEATRKWSEAAEWCGLEILATEGGGEGDDHGTVEFIARYTINTTECKHHETASFVRIGGDWFFEESQIHGPEPKRRDAPKVGRNDPCPCGSGKKYKKCCGKAE